MTADSNQAATGSDIGTIGIIGLGKMGKPMTRQLLQGDYLVVVHNRSRGAVDELVADGARAAASPAEIARGADVVISSLPDPSAVDEVYRGTDGLVANARSGQIYIDTSTVDPDLSRRIAAELIAKDAAFLDAPVSGGVAGAEAGSLTIMVGGDAAAFSRVQPVLALLGVRIHHVGASGSGTVIKLANQLLVGINMAGVAEAFVLGVKAGADPNAMLDVLSSSFGGSRMLDRGAPMIIARNFGGGTPVDLIRKDLGLIASLAKQLEVPLTCGENARSVFDRAHDAELGDNDMVAVVQPMERQASVEVGAQGDLPPANGND